MASSIVPWALGKNTTSILVPQDLDGSSGALTDNAIGSLPLNGRIDQIDQGTSLQTANLSPMHSFVANPVPYEQGGQYSFTEKVAALPVVSASHTGVGYSNVLRRAIAVSYYQKLTIQLFDNAGTPNQVDQWVAYVLFSDLRRSTSKEGIVDVGTFQIISVINSSTGAYQSNPTLTG